LQHLTLLLYLICFFLFGVGLFVAGQMLGDEKKNTAQSVYDNYEIPLRPLRFAIAIVLFSGLCNTVLLFPAALETILNLTAEAALTAHKICLAILATTVIALVLLGCISAGRICCHLPGNYASLGISSQSSSKWLNKIQETELFFIALSCALYLYTTLRFTDGYTYDTGLYHFPFVNHLVQFGAEIGLANFHSRYAFYNIQLFGQAPLQLLAFSKSLVAPSLNILFLASFLMFAYHCISNAFSIQTRNKPESSHENASRLRLKCISITSYWVALFSFGLTSHDYLLSYQSPLLSYNADFSSSVVASIVCFCFIVGTFLNSEFVMIAACLPPIKQSGIAAILYIIFFGIFVLICKILLGKSVLALPAMSQQLSAFRVSWRLTTVIIVSLYIAFFSTNIALSGYLAFPQYKTGPIGSHAVPYLNVVQERDRWIIGWARFRFDSEPRDVKANASTGSWLPQFVPSERGQEMLFWIVSSFFIAICSIAGIFLHRNKIDFVILFASAMSAGILSTIVLLILPPDPRFYTWISGLIAFNCIQLIALAPFVGLMAFSTLIVSASIAMRKPIATMKVPEVVVSKIAKEKITSSWRTRAVSKGAGIIVRKPFSGDQCWNSEPPCSPYNGFLKNENLQIIMEQKILEQDRPKPP